MAKFINIEKHGNKIPLLVNVDHIIAIVPWDNLTCRVITVDAGQAVGPRTPLLVSELTMHELLHRMREEFLVI